MEDAARNLRPFNVSPIVRATLLLHVGRLNFNLDFGRVQVFRKTAVKAVPGRPPRVSPAGVRVRKGLIFRWIWLSLDLSGEPLGRIIQIPCA